VIDKNNVVRSRNITINNEMPDLYVVGSGLSENERILLEGVQKVKENDKIQPELVAPKDAIARLKLYTE
jgi:membrane fusion protein (multidrug efflux system)